MYREVISQIWDGLTRALRVFDWTVVSAVATTFAALAAWRTASINKQALQDQLMPTLHPLPTGARLTKADPTIELAIRNIGLGAAKDVYVFFGSALIDGNFSIAAGGLLRLRLPAPDKEEAHKAIQKLFDTKLTRVTWTIIYNDIYERTFETTFCLYRHKDLNEDFFAVDRGLWRFSRGSVQYFVARRRKNQMRWRGGLNTSSRV